MDPEFKLFINKSASELRRISAQRGSRFLSAAAGQVLQALDAKAAKNAKSVRLHLLQAQDYWERSQASAEDQIREAMNKIEALRDSKDE